MGKRGLLLGSVVAFSAMAGLGLSTALSVAATSSTAASAPLVIGVDNATPSGKNFEYTDFFPRAATIVHNGDVVDFRWNTGSPDGFHTVTFTDPQTAWNPTNPHAAIRPDLDDVPVGPTFNTALFGNQPRSCDGSTAASACTFGGSFLSSAAVPTAPGHDFFVKMNLDTSATTVVHFVCLIHAGMQGSLTVLPVGSEDPTQASTQASLDAASRIQLAADTASGNSAESQAEHAVTRNPDGTHTVTMTAGTSGDHVEVLEMLPWRVELRPGDQVKWVSHSNVDIHTVTFPQGAGSDSLDPITASPPVCETEGSTDTPATAGPPTFGCAAGAEAPLKAGPSGGTVISSPTTAATSGIILAKPGPFPDNYSYSFPNTGSFAYQCRIHDHMVGAVVVNAAEAVSVPTSTPPQLAQTGGRHRPWLPLGLGLLLLVSGLGLWNLAPGPRKDLTG